MFSAKALTPFLAAIASSCLMVPESSGQSAVTFTVSTSSTQSGSSFTGFNSAGAGSGTVYALGFQAQIIAVDGISYDLDPLVTFCTELAEPISATTYTFQMAPMAYAAAGRAGEEGTASSAIPAGGIGALRAARAQWLFDNHAVSEKLSDWTFSSTAPLSLAFQLALWEVTHDSDLSLTSNSGEIFIGTQSDTTRSNAIAIAQGWLDDLSVAGIDQSYTAQEYHLWVLTSNSGNPANGAGFQDILIASKIGSPTDTVILEEVQLVPEPHTALMGCAGLSLLLRRKRSVSARA